MTRGCYFSLVALTLFAPSAWGAIVYVDATPNTSVGVGNTTIDGALVEFGTNATNLDTTGSGVGTDGLWNYRPHGDAAGGNYWETDTNSTEDEPTAPLITAVQLGPGTYELFGFFRPQASTYDVAFSLDGVDYDVFQQGDGTLAVSGDFVNPGDVGELAAGIGDMRFVSLGQVTLASTQSVSIYAQGPFVGTGTNSGQRTRYEGIGYEQVSAVPEPSSLLLVTLGALGTGLCVRRRRTSRNPS